MNKIFRARILARAYRRGEVAGLSRLGVVYVGISDDSVVRALRRRSMRKIYSIFRMVEEIREMERERNEPSAGDATPPGSGWDGNPLERRE
jgi:hypothetical protein